MTTPPITDLEQIIYFDLTNILSVLAMFFFWFTFISFALVSRRYSEIFKEETRWHFLAVAPTGFLIYAVVQAYGYGVRGSITDVEQLISYSLLTISGLLVLAGVEQFVHILKKLYNLKPKQRVDSIFILAAVSLSLLISVSGIWMGMPLKALLCDIGFAFMGVALLRYSLIVKDWVSKMKKPYLTWILLFIGVLSIIVFIVSHMIAYSQYVPFLESNPDAYYGLWNCRTIAFSVLAVGGLLSFLGGWLFFQLKLLKF